MKGKNEQAKATIGNGASADLPKSLEWERIRRQTLRLATALVIAVFAPAAWIWVQETGERVPVSASEDELDWAVDEPMKAALVCTDWQVPAQWSERNAQSDEVALTPASWLPIPLLKRINEAPLWCGQEQETYRFIYMPTFHNPMVLRVNVVGENMTLIGARFDGQAGFEFDPDVLGRVSRELNRKEVFEIRRHLGRIGFGRPIRYRNESGLDGSTWIFEGRRDGHYQQMVRWSPEAGAERDFGLALIRLSGLATASDDVY